MGVHDVSYSWPNGAAAVPNWLKFFEETLLYPGRNIG